MFGIDVPIFAFTHKPEVAIEVTNAGGMGALAASYYQPDELERILTDMDEKTLGRPYCIDVLFANKVGEVVPMISASRRCFVFSFSPSPRGCTDRGHR